MLFSILIPVYNVEKYLDECLESILNQTEQDFEIILINDGSTDSSGEICNRYQENYPEKICVIHQKNKGQFLTRRVAITIAKGDYFLFIDSDDYIRKDSLQLFKETIEQYHVDLILFNLVKVIDGYANKPSPKLIQDKMIFRDKSLEKLYQMLLSGEINNLCTKVVRNDLVDKNKDYSKIPKYVKCGEDLLQSFPIIANSKQAIYLDESLYYYRFNPESITGQFDEKSYQSQKYVWDQAEKFKFHLDEIEKKEMIASGKLTTVAGEIVGSVSKKCSWNLKEKLDYLKMLANDSFFIEAYNKGGNKNKKVTKKIILFLLKKKQTVTVYYLVRFAQILKLHKSGIMHK